MTVISLSKEAAKEFSPVSPKVRPPEVTIVDPVAPSMTASVEPLPLRVEPVVMVYESPPVCVPSRIKVAFPSPVVPFPIVVVPE